LTGGQTFPGGNVVKNKNMFPFVIAAGVFVIVNLACVIPGMAPAATPTPTVMPTDTATATPIPPTETPVPTATPNRVATQAYRSTQTAEAQSQEAIEVLQKIEYPTDTGSLAWYQEDDQSIDLIKYNSYNYISFGNGQEFSNYVLKSDVTWDAEGVMMCGFMMRSEEDFERGKQYIFIFLRFSGLPAWDLEFFENQYFKASVPGQTKFSSALNLDNGATNQFIIIAEDNKFTVFINGVRQGSYFDWSELASQGQFAFYAYHESGAASCKFSNSWVWALK
jgi:hypothetical protein